MLRELKIIIDTQNCEDVVRFYGAIFQDVGLFLFFKIISELQGDCWIAMELMDCSLDKFYRSVFNQKQKLPEHIIGFIAASVVRALNYLKEVHNIIHRGQYYKFISQFYIILDVKPSNILLNTQGFVKLCDFGISGYLVDSIARTQDVGCQIYMAVSNFLL